MNNKSQKDSDEMPDSRQQDLTTLAIPPRSDRLFRRQDLWYFRTREGQPVGPFRYRSEAESNLHHFVKQLKENPGHKG